MTTVQSVMVTATRKMTDAGIEDAARDVRVLMAHALGIEKQRMSLHVGDCIQPDQKTQFDSLIDQRLDRRPVSKIIGERAFYGREFHINETVLDPRPDTETLVDCALAVPFARLLDLGTGSGIIAISLLAEREMATGIATDVSRHACDIAIRNARRHEVHARLTVQCADWFAGVQGKFDLIVSNPPYIAMDEMPDLSPEVRNFDPQVALTDRSDGVSCYRQITPLAFDYIKPDGWLMFEIGPTQAQAVSELLRDAGFADVSTVQDIDGRDRVVKGRKR